MAAASGLTSATMKNSTIARCGTGLAALVMLGALPVAAQETSIEKEIRELKQGQQQIRRDLAEIKRLLEAQPRGAQAQRSPVEGKLFELGDNPVRGESTAKLTLIEFSDYQ